MKSILGEAILKCNDDDLTGYKDSTHFIMSKVEENKGKQIIAYHRRTGSFWRKRLVSFKGCTN